MEPSPNDRIDKLPDELAAIKLRAIRWSKVSHAWNGETLKVLLMPWVAPAAAANWIFEPLPIQPDIEVPGHYKAILNAMNGFRGLSFDLYGVASSDGLVNRKVVRPLSLKTANESWRHEFTGAEKLFHFGGCDLTPTENGGYFFDGAEIICTSSSGREVGRWSTFSQFLEQELSRTEAVAVAHDEQLRQAITKA